MAARKMLARELVLVGDRVPSVRIGLLKGAGSTAHALPVNKRICGSEVALQVQNVRSFLDVARNKNAE